jgi:hypothetical protein
MTTSHFYDAHCDTQPHQEPPYHEQLSVMQEMQETHETTLKQQGAIEVLQSLTITLSALAIRDDAEGDYYFGLYSALQVVQRKLDFAKGGGVL